MPRRPPHRRGRAAAVALLILAALLVGADLIRRGVDLGTAAPAAPRAPALALTIEPSSPLAVPSATPAGAAGPVLALTGEYPKSGSNTWIYGNTQGPVLGTAGSLRRFRVAIQTGVPEDVAAFGAKADGTLGDPRSWIAGRAFRLQRVPQTATAEFTIYLATEETARQMCTAGGVDIRSGGVPYTSCRTFGRVIINLTRWRESVPEYVASKIPLDVYRQYIINHEVGHQFGYNHELCPGPGKPAPIMQTQTLGLRGCLANSWPYVDGKRYAGRPEG